MHFHPRVNTEASAWGFDFAQAAGHCAITRESGACLVRVPGVRGWFGPPVRTSVSGGIASLVTTCRANTISPLCHPPDTYHFPRKTPGPLAGDLLGSREWNGSDGRVWGKSRGASAPARETRGGAWSPRRAAPRRCGTPPRTRSWLSPEARTCFPRRASAQHGTANAFSKPTLHPKGANPKP